MHTVSRRTEGFNLPCVPFASSEYRGSDPGVLVSRPLTTYTKALEMLHKHADKGYHKEAIVRSEEFLSVMTHQQLDIRSQLNQAMADMMASNSLNLTSTLKTIVFCGRQNIALLDHRDNAMNVQKDTLDIRHHGNFWALLNFRVDASTTILCEHLASASTNATYKSSIISNQIIDILADQIRQRIIRKVQGAKWFTVVADEVTDVFC